ncbi:MAG TPA: PspA/IM30 family protein [Polyangia bacterium]|nr:PspA/IM30 family protein [Polyangia bacterium]
MGILNRISTLLKSNVNAAIDKVSDPGKQIDQIVLEMEEQARKAREEVRQTLAVEKRHKQRVEALAKTSDEWEKRAERALTAGDENLARQALERKAEIDAERAEAERALREQADYADQLTQALKALDARVKETKMRKETLKAQARAQKSREGGRDTSAFDKYEALQTKVDVVEAEVALGDELAAANHEDAHSREVERKLEDLAKNKDLDDKLAALKAKLKKPDEA